MQLNLGPVDIRETMARRPRACKTGWSVPVSRLDIEAADDIGSFIADERRVRQMLFNLLANAVRLLAAGRRSSRRPTAQPTPSSFSVTDHGPGIPPDVMDKVFDWFETHSLGSHHRGAGLGLSLVRSFVELHGGTVRVDFGGRQGNPSVTCNFPLDEAAHRNAAE